MANLTAVRLQAIVTGSDGNCHTYRTYGPSAYDARKALYKAAKVFEMKVNKHTFSYRYDELDKEIAQNKGAAS